MRGRNAEKPWIGSFVFEPEEGGVAKAPTDPAAVDTQRPLSTDPDVEKQSQSPSASGSGDSSEEKGKGKEDEKDPNLVGFDGPEDMENPHNWPGSKKWRVTICMRCFSS